MRVNQILPRLLSLCACACVGRYFKYVSLVNYYFDPAHKDAPMDRDLEVSLLPKQTS